MDCNKEKSPRAVRGTATIHEDARFEFKPYAEGESTQKNVRAVKGGKTYETTSEKRPQRVVHLSCDANSPDLWTEYTNRLRQLGIKPLTEQQMPERQRLVNEGAVQVFLNQKQACLTYQGTIDLTKSRNWQGELMRQLQVIVRTLPAHAQLTKVLNSIKRKGGKQ